MIINPKVRGFICTTAHPEGCAANVQQQIDYIKTHPQLKGCKKALIIGASTGYGLASRIAAAFGCGAATIGVFFERPAVGKRTASAGWYNSAAFERDAADAGIYAKSINGDAFSDAIKQQTIELIQEDWQGGVDLVIYSLASPRRTDPKSGETFSSVLKPIGDTYKNKTVDFLSGQISEVALEAATQQEIEDTQKVMGGEDWQLWMDALNEAGVLADGVKTVAFSYIGPDLTFPIYRNGTIGKAKEHLEQTAHDLDKQLQNLNGHAYVSVNKGLVTQASAAIPVVPLYISLLYKVMKEKALHEGCIEQAWRLFADRLYVDGGTPVDEQNRIRIDDWEMRADVQQGIEKLWLTVTADNLNEVSDIEGYREDFYKLFGFGVAGVDYTADTDADTKIASIDA